ncbi:MAG: N-methyltryptophan oxidase [Thermomicrobiales bacterium]|nr:MAG: N-methyltryptophan oxidase [Thermomicrobiales bacterium]
MTTYDVIVAGGGTMGTAAAWALGKRGVRVLVLEQFSHVHTLGAHGGKTRVIRHAYAEGPEYIPLVLRADELWCQLGDEIGETVLHRVGALEMAAPGYTHARRARDSAAAHSVPFEWLEPAEVRRRWPAFRIPDDWEAGFGARSGFLVVEPALHGMATLARRLGVTIREHEPVTVWGATPDAVWVETQHGRYEAARLIVTAGAWAGKVLADLGLPLTIQRKILWWLDVEDPSWFAPERFPVFITDSPHGEIYGFPIFQQPGLKIANHAGGEPCDPDTVDRTAREGENTDVVGLARWFFPGVTNRVVSSAVCLYARTPDSHFILDRHPRRPQVIIAAGFSGHGFKFAPAIGEHLADLALDAATQPYPLFALTRFAPMISQSPAG